MKNEDESPKEDSLPSSVTKMGEALKKIQAQVDSQRQEEDARNADLIRTIRERLKQNRLQTGNGR